MTDIQIRKGFERMGPGAELRQKMLEELIQRAESQDERLALSSQPGRFGRPTQAGRTGRAGQSERARVFEQAGQDGRAERRRLGRRSSLGGLTRTGGAPVGKETGGVGRSPAARRLGSAAGALAVVLLLSAVIWFATARPLSQKWISNDQSSSAEIATAPAADEFVWQGRSYILADGRDAGESGSGLEGGLSSQAVGEQLGVIQESVDPSLIGCPVYQYLPAGCEALVAVLRDDSWQLFRFSNFLSYLDNGDEDMSAYLELYGLTGPEGLERVEFYTYPDALSTKKVGELSDAQELEQFYQWFSQLTDSSEAYFDALGIGASASGEAAGEKTPAESSQDRDPAGEDVPSDGGASPSYEGGGALEDSVKLRLVGTNGLVLEMEYYPRIGFISRHKASADFIAALEKWIHTSN